jgi:hypothetical protein
MEALERMVGVVRETGAAPDGDPELLAELSRPRDPKKV